MPGIIITPTQYEILYRAKGQNSAISIAEGLGVDFNEVSRTLNRYFTGIDMDLSEFTVRDYDIDDDDEGAFDPVKKPAHYNDGQIEVWDYIRDKGLNYHRGNAVKYISRAGKKDPNTEIQDLEKAVAYLENELKHLRSEKAKVLNVDRESMAKEVESLQHAGMGLKEIAKYLRIPLSTVRELKAV